MNEILMQSAVRAHQAGDFAEAARLYGEILRGDPRHFRALHALGLLYYQAGQFEEAQRIIGEAIRISPRSPDAFFTRGCALQRLNRPAEALTCFDHALVLRPNFADAQSNRGMVLMALNRSEAALESLDAALALDTSNAAAWSNRGCVLKNLDRPEEALASFNRAIAYQPLLAEAFINRGSAHATLKRYENAAADFEKALALDSEFPYARGNMMLYRMHACNWGQFEQDKSAIAAGLQTGKRVISPFVNLALSQSLADQLQCARIWAAHNSPPSPAPLWRGERYRHHKIRLAYVSADFHAHATAALLAGVIEHHDRNLFETIAISFGPDDNTGMRARMMRAFDRFVDVRQNSDAEIAALMRRMEIDIAVDLKGYTQDNRSGIFALRPAPLQVSYLGYPGTMGSSVIDYLIADRTVIPDEHLAYYKEAIVYLPDSYQCNDSQRPISHQRPTRREQGLPEAGFVFCCFNNSYKIAPEIFDVWMRLLHNIPGSALWLLDDNPAATRNLRQEADTRGIPAERLIFAQRVSPPEHLARHAAADLFLDTQPYGAHTTASDALWAGLPVLTMLGPTFAGRVAASLLRAVGLPELIGNSLESYETSALRLARDPAALGAIKAKLARNREACPLFDTAHFTRNLETAYRIMSERSQRGERPNTFVLDRQGPTPLNHTRAQAAMQLPDSAIAAFRQGCTLLGLNKPTEALACFEQALSIAPYFVEALTNCGALLLALKKHDEALRSLDAALAINPSMIEAWNNRGNALSELGRYEEAVASYNRVLAARPGIFEALVNRGTALLALRRAEDALASYDDALRTSPDSDDALNGRANALFELKRFDEANREYERILKRNPDHPYTLGILAFSRLHCCDWEALGEDRKNVAAAIRATRRAINPFQNLALSRLPEEQKQCAAIWVADKYPASSQPLWKGEAYAHERIRLAYLSAELRDHAVAQTIAGVFEHHDRTRFETIAISWGAPDSGPMRTRLVSAFEHFIEVEGRSDKDVARRLRDLEVDIAVDLMGFTGECRPGILAWRPAPIQINYLGFPGTMAAPYVDYLLADRVVIPESEQHHYSENIVYLPDSYLPNDSRRLVPNLPTRGQAGLPETGFVFVSFNNNYKFSPELFDIWMRLLRAVQGSVLWLSAANPAAVQNLRREAEARGIDAARLVIAPYLSNPEDHLARIGLADLFLDTLPYNAHATAADALRVGLPVLTCKGTTFAGRVAASLLHAAGVPELIADSLESYEALALRLACEPSALAALKAKLAASRATHAFFDTARFTRNLETALLSICARRQTSG